jgi:pimeloyl-ACP methyl ester carboxylesterase
MSDVNTIPTTALGAASAAHSSELRQVYERVLANAPIHRRYIDVHTGGRVHLLEHGAGQPVVLLHGTTAAAGFFLPLLGELEGVRMLAPDRPGHGLSDPIGLPRDRFRDIAVAWVDGLLDALQLDNTALVGHSGGGVWALWYALAHPDRVTRLVLIAPPAMPNTRCPLPIRVMATPGLGELMSRIAPPTPRSVLRFARFMGEQATIAAHPDLIDLFVAAGRDPVADRTGRAEIHTLASPFALLTPSGFRRRSRVRPDELRGVKMPTLLVWGEHDPLGTARDAQAVADLIPHGRLKVLPGGHAPWLGHAAETAATVADFMR